MIYIKKFTTQDNRQGGGGSNTLIAQPIIDQGFFPTPVAIPGIDLKIYYGNDFKNVKYSFSGNSQREVRIKGLHEILNTAGVTPGDIGIFQKIKNEENAYRITFSKQSDPDYQFFKSLLGNNNHAVSEVITDLVSTEGITSNVTGHPFNWLVYGAPGTGKSNYLENESAKFGERKKRITFYPDYTYSKFVGSYKPVTLYRKKPGDNSTYHGTKTSSIAHVPEILNEPIVDYSFVPGPFVEMLIESYKGISSGNNFLLLIEEINRANASSVFGEVFQLLDRTNGISDYGVRLSDEAMNFIYEALQDPEYEELRSKIHSRGLFIPRNFYLWATMNSSDQGVFSLDSAFKRRWSIKYLPLNENESSIPDVSLKFSDVEYHWNSLRRALNDYLSNVSNVSEDRLIAPFFLSKSELLDDKNINETFKNKLLLYLKDDVLRHKKGFFNEKNKTFSSIHENFRKDVDPVLNYDFFGILTSGNGEAAEIIKNSYALFKSVYGLAIPENTDSNIVQEQFQN